MNMNLPTKEQCQGLFEKYKMPANIVNHSKTVEKAAVFLAEKFVEAGTAVNLDLVSRASLLHDIDKTETIKEGFEHLHGKMSQEILEKEGFPEIGEIVLRRQKGKSQLHCFT